MTTTIKVEMANNSTARNVREVAKILGTAVGAIRHNGGRVVIVTVAESDVAAVTDAADASHDVV